MFDDKHAVDLTTAVELEDDGAFREGGGTVRDVADMRRMGKRQEPQASRLLRDARDSDTVD